MLVYVWSKEPRRVRVKGGENGGKEESGGNKFTASEIPSRDLG